MTLPQTVEACLYLDQGSQCFPWIRAPGDFGLRLVKRTADSGGFSALEGPRQYRNQRPLSPPGEP